MERFHQAQSARQRQERQWYYNMAFYFGQQHLKWRAPEGSSSYDLYLPHAPYWRVRPVINITRKIARKEISRLTAQKPNAYIMPASSEDRDIFAAQAGEQIWDSTWRRLKFNTILREAVFWQTICGNGFLHQWWDTTKMDALNDIPGDISISAITPFHIFVPDLKTTRLEEQPFIIHAKAVDKEWVRRTYGIEPIDKQLNVVDDSMLTVLGINHQAKDTKTIVLEVWVKPGSLRELPEGGMFTVAANQIVQGFEGEVYSHKEYPFSKLDGIPTGKFYNESIIVDLIPLQQELNRTRGQIVEAKNLMAKPQLQGEKGAVNVARITSEPGLVIERKMGFQPLQPIPMQNLPSYVTEEVNRLYADMADLSGQHEVSEGKTPPGVTAAVAISYLQEQDETIISGHFDSVEEAIEKTAKQCLTYVQDYWTEERTVQTVGLDNSFNVQTFKGSQLRGNTDIRVEAGSALPTSRAAKQAFITDLMKMGFIPPEEGLEVLEIGGLNRIYERVQVDRRQAQRENLKMQVINEVDIREHEEAWNSDPTKSMTPEGLKLEPPPVIPVNSYDNHVVHIDAHNRHRKSQVFEMSSPHVKAEFERHVEQHKMAMMTGENLQLPQELGQPLGDGVESQPGPGPEGTPPPVQSEQPTQPQEGMV